MRILKKINPDSVLLGLSFFFRFLLLYAIIISIITKHWTAIFISLFALVLTFMPSFISKNYKVYLPAEFEFLTILFIYMTIFLGEIKGYYLKYWWWDNLLHTFSGIAFGFLGFLLVYTLYKAGKISTKPIFLSLFAFCFALSIGAVWEMVEFNIDNTIHTDMQRRGTGVFDTMYDLTEDACGALFASIVGFFYLKGVKGSGFFDMIITRFISRNRHLIKNTKE